MTSTSLYPARTSASLSPETASLPPYSEFPEDFAAGPSRPSSPESLVDPSEARGTTPTPPPPPPFAPTTQLQIETPGKSWFSLPGPPRPAPVPVFALRPDGRPLPPRRPLYLSLRPARRSGSCVLVRADDETETPLVATTYRFGVGRPPQIRLLGQGDEEVYELARRRLLSRAQRVEVPGLGVFEWRYAGARERRAEGRGADSLLVMERVVEEEAPSTTAKPQQQGQSPSSSSSSSPHTHTHTRTRIAQLVRSADLRTPGTSRTAAGNGGRLMLDLRAVEDEKARERVQLLAVATALVMLKKEVDRRRMQQVAMMSGGAGC